MKIIDLLNKIANGEEVPEYISYYNKKESMSMIMLPCKDNIIYRLNEDAIDLGDEVKIIEGKKIPEKLSTLFSVETKQSKELNIEYANTNFKNMYDKINEICDYLESKGDK